MPLYFHHGAVLTGGCTGHPTELLDHVAAVGIPGPVTDGSQVQVGIDEVQFHGFIAKLLDELLAAQAEELPETLGKPGIAEVALRGQVFHLQRLGDVLLDIGGNIQDRIYVKAKTTRSSR